MKSNNGVYQLNSQRNSFSRNSASKNPYNLEENWVVISEAIQTILRREGYNNPYEVLKDLTRKHKIINKKNLHSFINKLDISKDVKIELKKISPYNYIGILK